MSGCRIKTAVSFIPDHVEPPEMENISEAGQCTTIKIKAG